MKFVKGGLLILFCLLASLASAQVPMKEQLIGDLMIKSGLQRQVEQIPEVIKIQSEQRMRQEATMSAAERYNIRTAFKEAFDTQMILKYVREDLTISLNEKDIMAALEWLNSPLGQKITAMEEQSSSGKAFEEMQQFAMNLSANPPDPQRMALIEQLDEAAHLTESSIDMKIGVVLAMSEAMACASDCSKFSASDLKNKMDSIRPQMTEASRQETMIFSLYGYQGLTGEELEQYINFYKTPAGTNYMKVVSAALTHALSKASSIAGDKLGQFVKEQKTAEERK